jgi:N-acetylglucosamine kinase-like BadF-type ATPase
MSLRVIGIDAGATKTVGYLAGEGSTLVAEVHAAGANFHTSAPHVVERVLRDVFHALTAKEKSSPAAVCVGMAGVDREDEADAVRAIVHRIGCDAPVIVVVNDGLIALAAGAGDRPGIVVISGTGSIVYGYNAQRQAARAGGWGHIIGDEGSGYWIGREALSAVVRAADGRGAATQLTAEVLEHFRIRDMARLPRIVYDRERPRMRVAALGPIVQRTVELGDRVATAVVDRAADELALAARSVASRLAFGSEGFPAILAGGAFQVVPALTTALTERLRADLPRSDVRLLTDEPARGAVHLALAAARGELRIPRYV